MNARVLAAEFLGTALLVATVVGSGVMAARLADGNVALALLGNTLATAAMLFVLITVLAPVSGAHLNPAVTLVALLQGRMTPATAAAMATVQIAGAWGGTLLAHAMFTLPLLQMGTTARSGAGIWLSEAVATFFLLLTILGTARRADIVTAAAVALAIGAGYWFTASTSFANPAVTVARSLSDTFAGIAPGDVPAFVAAQAAGALGALGAWRWFDRGPGPTKPSAGRDAMI